MVTVGDCLGPSGSRGGALIVFFAFSFWLTLRSTSVTLAGGAVLPAQIRVASADVLRLLLDLVRQSVTGHSSTNQRPRRGEIFDWTTGTRETRQCANQSAKRQISILRNLTYR